MLYIFIGLKIPATINRYLRDYQRDGVHFLYQHFSKNTGAILGDDMGLGKTVQVRVNLNGKGFDNRPLAWCIVPRLLLVTSIVRIIFQ